jgi:hypothetical protein
MRDWPRPIFAVLNGAAFDELPSVMAKADISPRSLFIEHDDPRMVRAGPWFAALDERHLTSLLRIDGIERATVFWGGLVDETEIFRHLRGLNLVDTPRPKDAPPDPFAADPETVLFRHWDPSVMALVLPVLEPAQRARLFGPMGAIAINVASMGGMREAKRQVDWPEAPRGRLQLSQAQMDRIAEAITERSHQRIAAYLREVAPPQTSVMDKDALLQFVTTTEAIGRGLGLVTERGLGQWIYLMLVSDRAILQTPQALAMLTDGTKPPDERIDDLLLGITGARYRAERLA